MSFNINKITQLIQTDAIYFEKNGHLARRIDWAWAVYNDQNHSYELRRKAQLFLVYAFDIADTQTPLDEQLNQLMQDKLSAKNEEYIPGRTPKHLGFSSKNPNPGQSKQQGKLPEPFLKAYLKKEILDVNDKSKQRDCHQGCVYFDMEQKDEKQIHIHRGLFVKNGNLFSTNAMNSHNKSGFAACTLNLSGTFSLFNHYNTLDGIAHSSVNNGAPVIFAGEVSIKKGKLLAITTHSGHYRPTFYNIYRLLEYFNDRGVNISKTQILSWNPYNERSTQMDSIDMYATPATCVFLGVKQSLFKAIMEADNRINKYQSSVILTGIYSFFDCLKRSNLTQRRGELLQKYKANINAFQQELKSAGSLSPQEFRTRLIALEDIISRYESENAQLSRENGKSETSGRLANNFSGMKKLIQNIKDNSINDVPKAHELMKNLC